MKWFGFAILLMIYSCCFTTAVTGRKGWMLLSGWLLPILAMAVSYESGMEINGLMVVLCLLLFFLCRRGMSDVKLWNIKRRKRHPILFGVLYGILFIPLLYVYAQMQIQRYFLNLQGWGNPQIDFVRMGLCMLPLLWLNQIYTRMIYTAIDRIYGKKQELRLLSCRTYRANEEGREKSLNRGYFLEGIQNGVTYYFRLTRRSFLMLQNEPKLILQTRTGIFGGMYVLELDFPEWLARAEKVEKRDRILGTVFLILVIAFGIWLFWLRA